MQGDLCDRPNRNARPKPLDDTGLWESGIIISPDKGGPSNNNGDLDLLGNSDSFLVTDSLENRNLIVSILSILNIQRGQRVHRRSGVLFYHLYKYWGCWRKKGVSMNLIFKN